MARYKTTLIILSTIFILILAALIYDVYKIRSENQQISVVANQADLATSESAVAGSILFIKNSNGPSINKIESLSLTNDELVPFIESIEKLGRDMGLNIKTTSVAFDKTDSTKEIKYPAKVRLIVDTDGEWGNSLSFLNALENLPTKVNIDSSLFGLNTNNIDASVLASPSGKQAQASINTWHTSTSITVTIFK